MNDIVERLRAEAKFANVALNFDNLDPEQYAAMCTAAADEITLLRQQLASAREALQPFDTTWADKNGWTDDACPRDRICDWFGPSDFYRAVTAIRSLKSGQEGKR